MINQVEWIKVVTDPLGIAAFALFLTFLVIQRTRTRERPWVTPVFIALAFISLLGGLTLSYLKNSPKNTNGQVNSESSVSVTINGETHGSNSPIIGIVEGNQSISNNTETENDSPDN